MNRKKRIIAKAIFAVLTAVMLFACKPEGEKVTGVVLDHRELKADIGQTVTLTATVLPAEAANPKVSWEAVPEGFVELTADGALCTVKAVKAGKAAVLVTTEDGGFTAICTVTVPQIAAESIELNRDELNLIVGNPAADTATLTATVFPENAENKTVSWSADKTDYIELTDNGNGSCMVKALKVGETVVTATTADGGFTATCTVTVSLIAAESIELNRNKLNLIWGDPAADTATLTATVYPENAENKTVSWSADKTGYIELTDNGNGSCTVKALKAGSVTVTATVEDSGHTATCTVTVSSVSAESVELDQKELNLIVGDPESETATLTATVFPENAENKTVSWNAVPKGVVELTVDGAVCTVKALKEGTAVVMVTAADGGFMATCTVTVPPVLPESIELDRDELNLIVGDPESETATLTASVFPENTTDKRVRWTAFPEGVVTLTDNGDGSCRVTALGGESATVTAVSVANSAVTAACRISVDYPYLTNTALIKAIDDRAKDSAGNWVIVGWTKESNGTVKLTPQNLAKIRAVTELNLAGSGFSSEEKLEDLGGIEYFTGLTYLNCYSNKLAELDLSALAFLKYLSCGGNRLTTLDVSGFTMLTYLECSQGALKTLDVSGCTALTSLSLGGGGEPETLKASGCTALTTLRVSGGPAGGKLTTLDASGCTALTELYMDCSKHDLTTLNISGCTALTEVDFGGSPDQLTTMNASGCTALTELDLSYSDKLTELDVYGCTALTFLNCWGNRLTELDVSSCTALTSLNCAGNRLTELDVTKNTALTTLECHSNNLTTLDVSGCTALTTLECYRNNLTTLDVSGCTTLDHLWCSNNNLTTLDVTKNTALVFLYCEENQLTTLDIRPLSGLSSLYCTPQTESDGVTTRQLTLKLTRNQKSKFSNLVEDEYLKPEVYN